MYKVRKVLNNNALLVIDTDKMQEIIFIGTGVGFNKKTNMIVDIDKNTVTSYVQKKGIDISKQVEKNDAIYLEIANEIIGEAAKVFNNFDRNIIITLADHIDFAIQRINSGLVISNPFKNDIKLLFAEEYEIAKNSVGIINNKWLFIVFTGLLNALFEVLLANGGSGIELVFLIPISLFYMSFSYMYYKTDSVVTPIVYRMLYNIVPTFCNVVLAVIMICF